MIEDPYPHFYATDFLPWDIYHQLLENMPMQSLYDSTSIQHILADGTNSRLNLVLSEKVISTMSHNQSAIWHSIHTILQSEELKYTIYKKLSLGLARRYSIPETKVEEIKTYPKAILFRETRGYYIKPHPDTRKKVITFQLALPKDDSQKHLGTTMYKKSLLPSDMLTSPRGFTKEGQYPFIPNSAFSFVVTNSLLKRSWHGREALTAEDGIRNSLLNIYYTTPQAQY